MTRSVASRLAAGRPRATAAEFLSANPLVRGRLIYHALRLKGMSPKGRVSAKAVTEAIRVECAETTTHAAGTWRLDNSLTPGFARWLAAEVPELRDAFEFRASAVDAAAGQVEIPEERPLPLDLGPCVFGASAVRRQAREAKRAARTRSVIRPPVRALRPGEVVAIPRAGISRAVVRAVGPCVVTLRDDSGRVRRVLQAAAQFAIRLQAEIQGVCS